jgi:hypothetical protein
MESLIVMNIFGQGEEKKWIQLETLQDEELFNSYASPNITRKIKWTRCSRVGRITREIKF